MSDTPAAAVDPADDPAFKAWAARWFKGTAATRTILREVDASEAFAAGRAEEREACARLIADKVPLQPWLADLIRARSQP